MRSYILSDSPRFAAEERLRAEAFGLAFFLILDLRTSNRIAGASKIASMHGKGRNRGGYVGAAW